MAWQFIIFVIFENAQRVIVMLVSTLTVFRHKHLKNLNLRMQLLPSTFPTSICLLCTLSTRIVKSESSTIHNT